MEDGQASYLLVSRTRGPAVPSTDSICSRDAFTSSGDFIISPHAAAKGLYIATCGSFHGYKFFPCLGKYVVQMLEDKLEPELQTKWAWDRERPDPSLFADFPRHEMSDLADQEMARL
jgi:glycine/D-amino acid oxidase-like deaminating enzyme